MLPRLHQLTPVQAHYLAFLEALESAGFQGDLNPDYANRTVLATDNSLYQVLPQAVIYPRSTEDLSRLAKLAATDDWQDIVLSPRGGGTGTNGQSLTDGIVVDVSKHMNQILEINADEGWVRVQSGVVKDQLNKALKEHGLFFAPELSTSNRATIGGMINTDASGQGSVLYGKTRDHVLALKTVVLGGEILDSSALSETELAEKRQQPNREGQLLQTVADVYERRQVDIEAKFPPLNRCLTGYDLAHIFDQGQFNLNNILCGSEGTLGFIAEAKLNVLPIPKVSALVNVFYGSFEDSLRDAQNLMTARPTSIETIDSTVLNLAREDISWTTVGEFFPVDKDALDGINLVEYTADSESELQAGIERLTSLLETQKNQAGKNIGYSIAMGTDAVKRIWAMRKRAVGLLGNSQGEARPVPFVEDTAVPPENLADFIMAFRAVLDRHQLRYGMFGHVDAGVLHVRPALDLKDEQQQTLVRSITEEVVALVKRYGGLLWGEHGKGVRSEFAPEFFGDLYPELQTIKRAFDPFNQLNPGKIATTSPELQLLKIDEVPMRGDYDRTVSAQNWSQFSDSVYCNGNGACFNFDPNDAMCPSWKVTRERKHSPKGRASLIREWLRLLSAEGIDTQSLAKNGGHPGTWLPKIWHSVQAKRGQYDFNHEVADSMSACLACKSCSGSCPIKVDVPEFRARFLQLYHQRYLRPLKDYFIGALELVIPLLARAPFRVIYNAAMSASWVKSMLANTAGMVDSPLIHSQRLDKALANLGVQKAEAYILKGLPASEKARSVVIVQDAFTSYFETPVVVDIVKCLQALGFRVWLAPFSPNGKPLHVHGFLTLFKRIAKTNQTRLNRLAESGIPLVGIDPSMTLSYRAEYKKYTEGDLAPVQLLQEFLAANLDKLPTHLANQPKKSVQLLSHCTEKTNAAASLGDWVSVFRAFNLELSLPATGCCGMAGTYGHEQRNVANSKKLYAMSWQPHLAKNDSQQVVATGYSCRSQAARIDQLNLHHPMQYLLQRLLEAK